MDRADHPLHRQRPPGRPRRPARAARAHPVRAGRARRLLGVRHARVLPARHGRAVEVVRLARGRGADQRPPGLRHRGRRPADPLPPRPVGGRGRHPAAAGPHLPGLAARLHRHDRPAGQPRGPRRQRGRRVPRGRAVDAGLRLVHPGRRHRLDDGAGGDGVRRADAPARLLVVRHPRQRRRRDGRPRAGDPGPGGLPRRPRAAPVLVPVRRPERVRGLRAEGVRRARAHAVVPVGRRLQLR